MGRLSIDFPHLLFQNPDLEHPATVWPLAGEWDMSAVLGDATIIGAMHGTWSGTALTPIPYIADSGNMTAAFTGGGIGILASSGSRWMGPMIVPAIAPSDNLVSYGVALLDTGTSPESFEALMIASTSADPIFGNWVQVSASGFQAFPVLGGQVQAPVSASWLSPAAPGDRIYVGIDYQNLTLVVQKNSEPIQQAGDLGILGIPVDSSLYGLLFATFATSQVAFQAGSIAFTAAATLGGHLPMQTAEDATPPADAMDGKQYLVTNPGSYKGYITKKGDRVRFESSLEDIWISRLSSGEDHDINPVAGLDYNPTDQVLTLSMRDGEQFQTEIPAPPSVSSITYSPVTSDLVLELADSTLLTTNISHGFVSISDITPTSGSDNVGNKDIIEDNTIFVSGVSSTHFVRVHVLAMSGMLHFKPTVTLGLSTPVPLTRSGSTDLWTGYVDIDTAGETTLQVRHNEGPVRSATLSYETPPVISSVVVTLPNLAVGQVDYAADDTFTIGITADIPFTALEVADEGGSATVAASESGFTAATYKTKQVTAASRSQPGNVPVAKYLKVRVQSPAGTWSSWFTTANIISLDNLYPAVTFNPIPYPTGQTAIKGGDAVVAVSFTATQYTSLSIDNPTGDLDLTDPTNSGAKVTLHAGILEYNLDVPNNNFRVQLVKTTNATSASFSTTVAVASIVPVIAISITGSPIRLQSGPASPAPGYPAAPSYSVVLRSTAPAGGQALTVTSLDPGTGTFQGAWTSGHTPTRVLKVFDGDAKGGASFGNLNVKNPAGITVTTISSGAFYVVGGFVRRPIYFPNQSREAEIGTPIVNTAKLLVTNLSRGTAGIPNATYTGFMGNDPLVGPFTYTITGPTGVLNPTSGTLVYSNDEAYVSGNNDPANLLTFEIEETT